MGRLTVEDLERVERRLAWQQIRRTLARMADKDLAELIATRDTGALQAAGISAELVRTAIGDSDPAEMDRRLRELFTLDEARADRLRELMEVSE